MINGKRARMTRADAERQESSAAGKQLPNVFRLGFHSAVFPVFVRVGGSLPEQTADVMELNARAAARANSCLLGNHSLAASRNFTASKFALLERRYIVTPGETVFLKRQRQQEIFNPNSSQMDRKARRLPIVAGR